MTRIALSILILTSVSAAQAATFECLQTKSGIDACISLPDDVSTEPATMASTAERSGGALSIENEFALDSALAPATVAELGADPAGYLALREAVQTQNQLRWIETFLKSGPASDTDLGVIAAGKR